MDKRNFCTSYIEIDDFENQTIIRKYAIELQMSFPGEEWDKEKVKNYMQNIIERLDVGAIRIPLEIKRYYGDWHCYFRYYPGEEKLYEKAREPFDTERTLV